MMDYPHRYSMAMRYDGGWNVYCLGCSEGAQDYVYPCQVRTADLCEPSATLWPAPLAQHQWAVWKMDPPTTDDLMVSNQSHAFNELAAAKRLQKIRGGVIMVRSIGRTEWVEWHEPMIWGV